MEMRTIYFDLDGTLADFYGVEGWLENLIEFNSRPYREATPLFNFSAFARQLHRLQREGYRIGIVSWLSKCGTAEFDAEVTEVKKVWLEKHLPSVVWDEIHIVSYGTPKSTVVENRNGFLFDDEIGNRNEWGENSFGVEDILGVLRKF